MKDVSFASYHGNEIKRARIELYWTDTYYLFENDYLISIITLRNGVWAMTDQSINGDKLLTSADLDVLSQLIIMNFEH